MAETDVASERESPSVAVLMYHRIAAAGSAHTATWRVSPDRFEQQLSWLQQTGHKSISQPDLVAFLSGKPLPHPRSVLLTFDDGYLDFQTNALPLLKRYGFGAVVFAVTDRVGTTSSWDRHLLSDEPLMTWSQLREIQAGGIDIGSHAVDHVPLSRLNPAEAQDQLTDSRRRLESELDRTPCSVAYPFGATSPAVSVAAEGAGYRIGFGTREARVTRNSHRYDLERLTVTEDWTLEDMADRLAGPL